MKVLILSNTPWREDNSFGNSFSNIFGNIPNLEIANIFFKYGEPDNNIVKRYFQITEKSLINNLKDKTQPSGSEIFVNKTKPTELNEKERQMLDSARKKRWMQLRSFHPQDLG